MRDGDVGFVRPDGRTDAPRVRVEPALFEAADKVKDGELVPEPVPIDGKYAVIWRRGSMPAITRTVEQEARSIQQILLRKRLEDQRKALIESLRKKYVRDENDGLLDYVDVSAFGDVASRRRSGIAPRLHPTAAIIQPANPGFR
jgi:peptidyl-prolyl cis-trans isomerase C